MAETQAQAPACSPLEQEVLDEYTTLLENLTKVNTMNLPQFLAPRADRGTFWIQLSSSFASLADNPTAEVLDGLRMLERKTSLVCTLLKASVYSIVLQQQIYSGEGGEGAEE